jgi:hypothetical protein
MTVIVEKHVERFQCFLGLSLANVEVSTRKKVYEMRHMSVSQALGLLNISIDFFPIHERNIHSVHEWGEK